MGQKERIGSYVIIIVVVLTLGFIQRDMTTYRKSSWIQDDLSYLPKTDEIKPFLLGFAPTYSNYIWIETMLYFGEHYRGDKDFRWLVSMVDIVTKLDPEFYPAYEFAGVMLPEYGNDPQAALVILNRGVSHVKERSYMIPFYIGWIHYDYYKNPREAAYWLTVASQKEGAPPFMTEFAATLYKKSGEKDLALHFLRSAYESTTDSNIKRAIEEKLEKVRKK